jgi:dTDP-4-amino-4,6-dideoxygalactose transaminase
MVPRTKVNYGWRDLGRALWLSERRDVCRTRLIHLLQRYLGTSQVLLTASGRGALFTLLRAVPQSRVILPAYTCKAVTEAALMAGKTVIHVDGHQDGFNLHPSALERVVDADSVVVATHQYGIPCDIQSIVALCRERGAFLVEDAAAALGTRIGGELAGTFGDAAFFSFDSTKLIHVPLKGGFLTVRDSDLFRRVAHGHLDATTPMSVPHKLGLLAKAAVLLLLENPSLYRAFHLLQFQLRGRFTADDAVVRTHRTEFYRHRFSEWQAAVAVPQVERIEDIVRHRRSRYAALSRELEGLRALELPPRDARGEWACVRFPVRVRGDKLAYYRDAARLGVDFAFSFSFLGCPEELGEAHQLAAQVVNLPFYGKLTDGELSRVVAVLRKLESAHARP